MKKNALTLLTLVLFLSLITQAMARGEKPGAGTGSGENGWSSSGGDDTPASIGAAWFLGDAPIKACLIVEQGYPKSITDLTTIVLQSARTWKNYYQNKVLPMNTNRLIHPSFMISLQETCDTTTELKIIFGLKTPDVQVELKKYYNPFGFATLQSYDVEKKRGKGFIWIANPKEAYAESHEASLNALVLHELGHVYGVPHVKGTIMDEKIAEVIKAFGPSAGWPSNDPKGRVFLTSIETERPLYFHYAANWSYEGFAPVDNSVLKPEFLRTIFGRDVTGDVLARFYNQGPWTNYKIDLTDIKGSKTFSLENLGDGTVSNKEGLFKMLLKSDNSPEAYIDAINSQAWEIFGNFVDQKGVRYPAIITLNLGDFEIVQVRVYYKNELLKIFGKNASARSR